MYTGELARGADVTQRPVRYSANQIVPKPKELSLEVADLLYVAGTTAYAAVKAVNAGPGDTVAVSAAARGVGTLVVQMLRNRGAEVLDTVSERDHEWLRSVGAKGVTPGEGLAERLRRTVSALLWTVLAKGIASWWLTLALPKRSGSRLKPAPRRAAHLSWLR